ncbi:carbohydrate ABC transporter permease [Granulicatella adiacens]|jgi:polysaccharide ABC transporter permease|uniref:carbohydrate ABC transporter permease n=1 Tax=Granulicatella TaxID=117563 RepID=UPI00066A53E2|nr:MULTISPECIES: carbohydrate ABC transporter permease [Granulicatella]MBF1211281.1 carbohydrate ABC transporter permease [Granulicatella sp.]OFS99311.1 ABC transporter permease [Granulicatella sp. HMSC31F03]OFT78458.1 ABC transporter permease [Granulicatella sp. HMSC30F09]RKW27329.1 MAG: carbohydrate ABC transporter permease [Granulicatella sp.]UXY41719.1 carbohydrate ABC transporter permease [Granulicatella adiacens]
MKEKFGIRQFIIYVVVILLTLSCLIPLMNVISLSFSSSQAVASNKVGLWPEEFTFAAYEKIINDAQFWRSFGISVFRVAMALIINLFMIVTLAYPLSKSVKVFRSRKVFMNIMVFAMLFSGGMIPSYLVVRYLGLINSVWALILPGAVPIGSVILVMNFFRSVPKSLEESALLDGANPWQILTRIYIPISLPSLATVSLFSIVGSWNDFFGGLIYITKVENYPLMTYIQSLSVNIAETLQKAGGMSTQQLQALLSVSNRNLNAAKIVVAIVPLLVIYPFLQKYFVQGIVVGAVKE